jgi:hypothetical protein
MPPPRKQYWTTKLQDGSDICTDCGDKIDFNNQVGIIAIRQKLNLAAPDEIKDDTEKFYFCLSCGTDIDRLHALGMKMFLGFLNGPSQDLDEMVVTDDGDEVKH